jgi:hypothetical protein
MGEEQPDTGRCVNCGLLGIRIYGTISDRREVFEMESERRERGDVFNTVVTDLQDYRVSEPVCIRGCANFRVEIGEPMERSKPRGSDPLAAEIFARDRKCPQWRQYVPGTGPNMELQFAMFDQLEKHRQEWEARLEEARREWESRLARDLENDRRAWHTNFTLQLEEKREENDTRLRRTEGRLTRWIIAIMILQSAIAISIAWWQDRRSAPLPTSEATVREPLTDDEPHGQVEP